MKGVPPTSLPAATRPPITPAGRKNGTTPPRWLGTGGRGWSAGSSTLAAPPRVRPQKAARSPQTGAPRQRPPPEGDLLLQDGAPQPAALPDGEVDILDRQLRQRRGEGPRGRRVEGAELADERRHRPAVGDDVVHHQQRDEVVLAGGGRRPQQRGAQQRTRGEIEGAAGLRRGGIAQGPPPQAPPQGAAGPRRREDRAGPPPAPPPAAPAGRPPAPPGAPPRRSPGPACRRGWRSG